MKEFKHMKTIEIAGSYLIWGLISWIWYKNILFRSIGLHTLRESRHILLILLIVLSTFGVIIETRKCRYTSLTVKTLSLGIAYGMYTCLAYYHINKLVTTIPMIIAAVLSIVYSLLVFFLNNNEKKNVSGMMHRRIEKAGSGCCCIVGGMFIFIICILSFNSIFGATLLKPSVKAKQTLSEEKPDKMSNRLSDPVSEEMWNMMTLDDRLNTLQEIANSEAAYLGLSHELNVGADNQSRETLLAYYYEPQHLIVINIDCLLYDSLSDNLNNLLHEAYHAYQFRLVSCWESADEHDKNLMLYRDAPVYKNELIYYSDPSKKDYCTYYNQQVEEDARAWARSRVSAYLE